MSTHLNQNQLTLKKLIFRPETASAYQDSLTFLIWSSDQGLKNRTEGPTRSAPSLSCTSQLNQVGPSQHFLLFF